MVWNSFHPWQATQQDLTYILKHLTMISWLRTVDTVLTESICDFEFHQCAINIEVQQRDNVDDL